MSNYFWQKNRGTTTYFIVYALVLEANIEDVWVWENLFLSEDIYQATNCHGEL